MPDVLLIEESSGTTFLGRREYGVPPIHCGALTIQVIVSVFEKFFEVLNDDIARIGQTYE